MGITKRTKGCLRRRLWIPHAQAMRPNSDGPIGCAGSGAWDDAGGTPIPGSAPGGRDVAPGYRHLHNIVYMAMWYFNTRMSIRLSPAGRRRPSEVPSLAPTPLHANCESR